MAIGSGVNATNNDLIVRFSKLQKHWLTEITARHSKETTIDCSYHQLSHLMGKPTKWHVRPAKTQISLGIRPVWPASSLSAWRKLGFLATHWAQSEDSDQTGRMPRLIWVFAGRTCHFVGFVTRWLNFDWIFLYCYMYVLGFSLN